MPKKQTNEIRCTFLSKSENEALARSIISGFLLPLDPTVDELADIRLAISEAVTNCIVHGYRGTSGMITLGAKAFDDRSVRITVIDKASAKSAPPERAMPSICSYNLFSNILFLSDKALPSDFKYYSGSSRG